MPKFLATVRDHQYADTEYRALLDTNDVFIATSRDEEGVLVQFRPDKTGKDRGLFIVGMSLETYAHIASNGYAKSYCV